MPPVVLLVTGPPGAGKTTLAAALAARLGWPVVSRDAIKVGLTHAAGFDAPAAIGGEIAEAAYELLYQFIRAHVDGGVSVIVENAFRCDLAVPEVLDATAGATVRIVHLRLDEDLAQHRFSNRSGDPVRRAAHPDAVVIARMRRGAFRWDVYEPLDVGAPVLEVDVSDGWSPGLDEIAAFASIGTS